MKKNVKFSGAIGAALAMVVLGAIPAVGNDDDATAGQIAVADEKWGPVEAAPLVVGAGNQLDSDGIPLMAVSEKRPTGVAVSDQLPEEYESPIPQSVFEHYAQLPSAGVDIDSASWDAKAGTLTLYVTGSSDEMRRSAAHLLPDIRVDVVTSVHSRAEVSKEIYRLLETNLGLKTGDVTYAIPATDGSLITIGVAGLDSAKLSDVEASLSSGIPVQIVESDPLAATAADTPAAPDTRIRTTAPVFGGQYMQSSVWACSTGFWVGTSTTASMLSADHCGGAIGETWYYGGGTNSSRVIGTAQGQAPGGTDLELFTTTTSANITGYVMTGSYVNNTSVSPIRGAWSAQIIGDSVCYSGSRSGLVCQNIVTAVAGAACYPGYGCYYNLTFTQQANQTPAAGNGDSGGPVIAVRNGGQVYATGINSGMTSASTTCTGDPGEPDGRNCSYQNMFAPLLAFFNNTTGYGLYYIPQ